LNSSQGFFLEKEGKMETFPIIETCDLYEIAYYLSNDCVIKDVEVFKENKDLVCKILITGIHILQYQLNFFQSTAMVNVNEFRRNYNRVFSIVTQAKKNFKQKSQGANP
jgi:hypothetical protein